MSLIGDPEAARGREGIYGLPGPQTKTPHDRAALGDLGDTSSRPDPERSVSGEDRPVTTRG